MKKHILTLVILSSLFSFVGCTSYNAKRAVNLSFDAIKTGVKGVFVAAEKKMEKAGIILEKNKDSEKFMSYYTKYLEERLAREQINIGEQWGKIEKKFKKLEINK